MSNELKVAQPRRVVHEGTYTAKNLTPTRPGAENHLKVPSLVGGRRVYRKDSGNAQAQ